MTEPVHLSVESALAFLLIHDPEEAQHLGLHIPLASKYDSTTVDFKLISDLPGFLTVKTTKREPLEQTIIVEVPVKVPPTGEFPEVPAVKLVFEHNGPFKYPKNFPYPLQDCLRREGTLYTIGVPPVPGTSSFNAQQFPKYPLKDDTVQENSLAGRVVIDFWDKIRITGVFKTKAENYISGGTGKWFLTPN